VLDHTVAHHGLKRFPLERQRLGIAPHQPSIRSLRVRRRHRLDVDTDVDRWSGLEPGRREGAVVPAHVEAGTLERVLTEGTCLDGAPECQ
jgi:hypothetical protein